MIDVKTNNNVWYSSNVKFSQLPIFSSHAISIQEPLFDYLPCKLHYWVSPDHYWGLWKILTNIIEWIFLKLHSLTTLDFEMIACNRSLSTSILLDKERPLKEKHILQRFWLIFSFFEGIIYFTVFRLASLPLPSSDFTEMMRTKIKKQRIILMTQGVCDWGCLVFVRLLTIYLLSHGPKYPFKTLQPINYIR